MYFKQNNKTISYFQFNVIHLKIKPMYKLIYLIGSLFKLTVNPSLIFL